VCSGSAVPTYIARELKELPPEWSLISDSDFRGCWHEIVVDAYWSAGVDGFFNVWVNGVQKVKYTGLTCFAGGIEIYHKYGSTAPHHDNPDAVVRHRDLKRGASQSDVTTSVLGS
jgi:hypothetical protein